MSVRGPSYMFVKTRTRGEEAKEVGWGGKGEGGYIVPIKQRVESIFPIAPL